VKKAGVGRGRERGYARYNVFIGRREGGREGGREGEPGDGEENGQCDECASADLSHTSFLPPSLPPTLPPALNTIMEQTLEEAGLDNQSIMMRYLD